VRLSRILRFSHRSGWCRIRANSHGGSLATLEVFCSGRTRRAQDCLGRHARAEGKLTINSSLTLTFKYTQLDFSCQEKKSRDGKKQDTGWDPRFRLGWFLYRLDRLLRHALADIGVQIPLPQPDTLRSHLHKFIVADPFNGLLQCQKPEAPDGWPHRIPMHACSSTAWSCTHSRSYRAPGILTTTIPRNLRPGLDENTERSCSFHMRMPRPHRLHRYDRPLCPLRDVSFVRIIPWKL